MAMVVILEMFVCTPGVVREAFMCEKTLLSIVNPFFATTQKTKNAARRAAKPLNHQVLLSTHKSDYATVPMAGLTSACKHNKTNC
jgi:hypothetical protein